MVINLALGKPTKMSSVSQGAGGWKGVDGKREPNVFVSDHRKHTCIATAKDTEAWWLVDLESVYAVREVVIYSEHNRELQCFAGLV